MATRARGWFSSYTPAGIETNPVLEPMLARNRRQAIADVGPCPTAIYYLIDAGSISYFFNTCSSSSFMVLRLCKPLGPALENRNYFKSFFILLEYAFNFNPYWES